MLLKFVKSDGKITKIRTKLELTGAPVTIGRGSDADIQVDDGTCSRIHCAIRRWDDMYIIRDMDSSNGTKVNGEPVRVAELLESDTVRIGGTEFSFEAEGREEDLTIMRDSGQPGA